MVEEERARRVVAAVDPMREAGNSVGRTGEPCLDWGLVGRGRGLRTWDMGAGLDTCGWAMEPVGGASNLVGGTEEASRLKALGQAGGRG